MPWKFRKKKTAESRALHVSIKAKWRKKIQPDNVHIVQGFSWFLNFQNHWKFLMSFIFLYFINNQPGFNCRVLWKKTYLWRILQVQRNEERRCRSDFEHRDVRHGFRFLGLEDLVEKWRKEPWELERALRRDTRFGFSISGFHLSRIFKIVKREHIDIKSRGGC